MDNKNLAVAMLRKDDEFYTRYEDIEAELTKYKDKFYNKIVYMPCDDPSFSNFWRFFVNKFDEWHLKSIKASFLDGYLYEFDGKLFRFIPNWGDFRKNTDIKADIIVTNPPFSLIRDFIRCFGDRKFIFIATFLMLTYSYSNEWLKTHKIYVGGPVKKFFCKTEGEIKEVANAVWYTSFKVKKEKYLKKRFKDIKPQFTDSGVLVLDKVIDTPIDYKEPMLVPVTFFKFVNIDGDYKMLNNRATPYVNGKRRFKRFLVWNRKYIPEGLDLNNYGEQFIKEKQLRR